jgi:hypothetical protein
VSVCPEGYQWILQQRKGEDHWESRKFFSNKDRLAHVVQELLGAKAYDRVRDRIQALLCAGVQF